ncbi:type II secretion system protein N [Alkalimarinus alittae]|uniref:Type II secretion system protein N n=1 Tax=Alkalimarinus alittae TaxID=2961619 RepID=A0ABY6N5N3_9ALTE|nr:type II secretion system protein N [Alkalimarinus alittae]UZE97430.1 type II secretion system protein N [Alkalimarinus alittae]
MFKKILLFVLVWVISYITFLVATVPASFAWNYISPQLPLNSLQLNVDGVSGTAWNGYAYMNSRGIEGVLGWDISFLGLLTGQLPVKIELKSNVGQLDTTARLFSNGIELSDTKGRINLPALNPLLKQHRITVNGTLEIDSLTIGLVDGMLSTADGSFSWTGGRVEYPAGREVHGNEFPSFTGRLGQKAGNTSLVIKDTESSVNAIEGVMNDAGLATLKVKRRLLDLANEPWPENSSESDVVFKIQRKVGF